MNNKSLKHIRKLFGFTRQQLHYWRKNGLIAAPQKTGGGHYRYEFQDLVVLKTIHTLKKHGISTYRIRRSFETIKSMFGGTINPFIKKRVMVYGQNIVFVHRGKIYDALSGQAYLFDLGQDLKKVNEWTERVVSLESDNNIKDSIPKKKVVRHK